VHTICYSILLLNTDLHLADIESKMTKSQFVKNTIPTILRVVADAAPEAFEPSRPTILSPKFEVPEPEDELRHDLNVDMRALRDQVNAFEPEKQPATTGEVVTPWVYGTECYESEWAESCAG
jgi:hypothetical protein